MISAVIITKNEESRIQACLESVKWADEIITIDNGSNDNTVKIAKNYTEKIFETNLQDFAEIRDLGFKKTSGDWVLFIDADERVSEPLKLEIKSLITKAEYSAYAISRKNIIFGQEVKYGPFWPDWVIRLLKKDQFEGWVGKVHEYPRFKGKLGYTKNSFIHLTHRNIDQIILKSLEWSKIDAKLRFDSNHPKMSGWRFFRIIITEIFNQGILRKGFFNGTIGIMDSLLQIISMIMSYIRLWQMQQQKNTEEIYNELDNELIKNNFRFK